MKVRALLLVAIASHAMISAAESQSLPPTQRRIVEQMRIVTEAS